MTNGGYDEGYLAVPCLWGTSAGSLVQKFLAKNRITKSITVLDLGCGEGKNSAVFARLGCHVDAVDCSAAAINNGRSTFRDVDINWLEEEAQNFEIKVGFYDVIIAYGLLHCFHSERVIEKTIERIQAGTKSGGSNIVCSFNNRSHDLSAHPGFHPTLLPHQWYIQRYAKWDRIFDSDADLYETHPHNNVPHYHSLTRLIARKL